MPWPGFNPCSRNKDPTSCATYTARKEGGERKINTNPSPVLPLKNRLPWWLSSKESTWAMQEAWVWSLVQEDLTCCRATEPMHWNYWIHRPRTCSLQQEGPEWGEAHRPQLESGSCSPQPEKVCTATETQHNVNKIINKRGGNTNSFYKISSALILKPDKDTTRKFQDNKPNKHRSKNSLQNQYASDCCISRHW